MAGAARSRGRPATQPSREGSQAGPEGQPVVLITGGNSGIGKATAVALAAAGADVTFTARDAGRGQQALADIKAASGSDRVHVMSLDLARMASVPEFASAFLAEKERLDVLILNAGVYLATRRMTEDGFETMFQVNHLAHFLLAKLLEERLVHSAPARVVVVASVAHKGAGAYRFDDMQSEQRFTSMGTYQQTKLANVLFAREGARRLGGTGVTVNALHPGTVSTGWGKDGDSGRLMSLGLKLSGWWMMTPEKGARTSVHLALSPEVEGKTGGYYVKARNAPVAPGGLDDEAARLLWDASEKLVAPWLGDTGG